LRPSQRARELVTGVPGHLPNRYNNAAACYEVNTHVLSILWDFTWRHGYKFDVITFLGEDMLEGVSRVLDSSSVPFANLWAEDVNALSKRLAHMLDVIR